MDKVKKLNLAVIGLSEGNGHPYSWSAIFNGYDPKEMNQCPFPVIPQYLSKQKYPDDFLGDYGHVSHVWTQDARLSSQIAKSSKIPYVVENFEDLIGKADAILLARDDAENHFSMASPFIKAGLPIFIDKPFALTLQDAEKMLSLQKFETQIFTCSSLRYANELMLDEEDWHILGDIVSVEASVMKYWNTYGIHLIEPIIANIKNRGELLRVKNEHVEGIRKVHIKWEHFSAILNITGDIQTPLSFKYIGTKGTIHKNFSDSFSCFKKSLKQFVLQTDSETMLIPRTETLEAVKIIEWGNL